MSQPDTSGFTNSGRNYGNQINELNIIGRHVDIHARLWLIVLDSNDTRKRTIEWISPLDFRVKLNEVLASHEPGTGQWLLQSPKFKEWLNGSTRILWCYGIRE